jgi:hypothetical protein
MSICRVLCTPVFSTSYETHSQNGNRALSKVFGKKLHWADKNSFDTQF